MSKTLKDPQRLTHNSGNDTYCLSAVIYLRDRETGEQVGSAIVRTIIGAVAKNVITTYPINAHC